MKFYLTFFILLAGCATQSQTSKNFDGIVNFCSTKISIENKGNCIEKLLDAEMPEWKQNIHAAYVETYIEWLKAAGSKVSNGTMTGQEAVNGSNELLSRMRVEAKSQQSQVTQSSITTFLSGLALIYMANQQQPQQYNPVNSTTYIMPNNRMINCIQAPGSTLVSCR